MKKVAIIGSGSAGAATALFLKEGNNIDVTLLEREAKPRPVGAGFMLQLTGLQVLKKLNLLDKVTELGHSIHKIDGLNKSGSKILNLNFKKINQNFQGIGIHRGTFFTLLHSQLKKKNIPVITDCEVTDISQQNGYTEIINQKGDKLGPFDLVVIANGASSKLREKYPITKKAKRQKWGAAWTVLPYNNKDFDHTIFQVYDKSKQMVGVMPIGKKVANESSYINLFWSLNMEKVSEWKDKGVDHWKKEIIKLAPQLSDLVSSISSFDDVMHAPYYDVKLSPYHSKNIVFIGDSAHAMSPQLSCGVNNALLDAQALSNELIANSDWEIALNKFYSTRKKHNQFYQRLCRVVTPLFQSNYPFISLLRDFVLGKLFSGSLPTKLMVENTMGIREGIFKRIQQKYYLSTVKS